MTRRHYHILENEWVFDVNLTCAVKVILTADSALTRTLLAKQALAKELSFCHKLIFSNP